MIGVEAVNLATGAEETYRGPVILATGHSARDVYRYLASEKMNIEAKGIAVGVRLEHPSQLIDQIQYHNKNGRGKYLPAAEYSFVTQVDGRGVYSFCMCPGGFVIPAATGPEQARGERYESEQPRYCLEQLGHGGGNPSRGCGAVCEGTSVCHRTAGNEGAGECFTLHSSLFTPNDVLPGNRGKAMLAAGQHEADCSGTAHG